MISSCHKDAKFITKASSREQAPCFDEANVCCLLVELAVIVGKDGRNISASNADEYVGGNRLEYMRIK